ncbi:MAG: hypothetical protein QME49_01670 [bacterium]|nr:hypothetical protein [bacterium]
MPFLHIIFTAISKIGWVTIMTTVFTIVTWYAVPIFMQQNIAEWKKETSKDIVIEDITPDIESIHSNTSPLMMIGILGAVWGIFLILKKKKKSILGLTT